MRPAPLLNLKHSERLVRCPRTRVSGVAADQHTLQASGGFTVRAYGTAAEQRHEPREMSQGREPLGIASQSTALRSCRAQRPRVPSISAKLRGALVRKFIPNAARFVKLFPWSEDRRPHGSPASALSDSAKQTGRPERGSEQLEDHRMGAGRAAVGRTGCHQPCSKGQKRHLSARRHVCTRRGRAQLSWRLGFVGYAGLSGEYQPSVLPSPCVGKGPCPHAPPRGRPRRVADLAQQIRDAASDQPSPQDSALPRCDPRSNLRVFWPTHSQLEQNHGGPLTCLTIDSELIPIQSQI